MHWPCILRNFIKQFEHYIGCNVLQCTAMHYILGCCYCMDVTTTMINLQSKG